MSTNLRPISRTQTLDTVNVQQALPPSQTPPPEPKPAAESLSNSDRADGMAKKSKVPFNQMIHMPLNLAMAGLGGLGLWAQANRKLTVHHIGEFSTVGRVVGGFGAVMGGIQLAINHSTTQHKVGGAMQLGGGVLAGAAGHHPAALLGGGLLVAIGSAIWADAQEK